VIATPLQSGVFFGGADRRYHERPDEALDPPLRNGFGSAAIAEGTRWDLKFDAIFGQIRQWRDLVTCCAGHLIRTWGSSPRPPGSHLAVDSSGRFVGSVYGRLCRGGGDARAEAVIAMAGLGG